MYWRCLLLMVRDLVPEVRAGVLLQPGEVARLVRAEAGDAGVG